MAREVYRSTAAEMVALPAEELLSAIIAEHLNRTPKPSAEQRSWDISLPQLAKVLVDADLAKVDMLIEYPLPESTRRADVVLAGVHPKTGEDNYVAVELKQWSEAELAWDSDLFVRGRQLRGEHLHPIDQVRGYCKYLRQYVAVLHDRPEAVHGIAYLHNATENSVSQLRARQPDDLGRLFTGEQRDDLVTYLRGQFAPEPGAQAADRLLASEIRPRKTLLQFTTEELRHATEYSLLDNQQLAYELVMHRVRLSADSDRKSVIVVTGGPGSGKSLIAMALLADLHRDNRRARYATGSKAFTESLRRFPGRGSKELQALFTYFNSFTKARKNDLDVVICDEAHRLRRTSTNRFTPKADRSNRPQVDELMAAARVPVFFLDENQVVRPDEIGTVEEISAHAARLGYPVFRIDLQGQFRCGGSAVYDEWVLRLLGLRVGGPTPWTGDERFDVRFAASPQEMEDFLRGKNDVGVTARMSAGFCWPWSSPREDGTLVRDVVIGDWSRPWNLKSETRIGDAPPTSLWATDPRGFGQVGCIYTAQGFEYDWAGVILGPDIVVDDGQLAVRRECNVDSKLKGTKSAPVFDEDFERLVRTVYKVLLTRGMKGVVIHAVDPATQTFIADLIGAHRRVSL